MKNMSMSNYIIYWVISEKKIEGQYVYFEKEMLRNDLY